MSLEKWKKNGIYEAIVEAELDPRDFRLVESEYELRIQHLRSPSFFLVYLDRPGYYEGTSLVGDGPVWPYSPSSGWPYLTPRISSWLSAVKRDLEIPDLWAELQAEANMLGAGFEEAIENAPFTPDEEAEIAGQLYELRDQARNTYTLSDLQVRALEAKIDYLIEASTRVGRNDWWNVVIGAMFSYAWEVSMPPDAVRSIMLSILKGVAHFYAQGFMALS